MMTQTHFNGNTCSFFHMLNPCAIGESVFVPSTRSGDEGLKMLMAEDEKSDVKIRTGPYQSASETPLWPSLRAVRSAMGTGYFWKQELEKALRYRSFLISAAMLTMLTLGVMAI